MPPQSPPDEVYPPLLGHRASTPTSSTSKPTLPPKSAPLNLKIAAAMFSFTTLGLFNSSTGVTLPLISHHYTLTDLHVSLIFVAGPLGYIAAAQLSSAMHHQFGQRGIAVLGPLLQILAAGLIGAHLRFGVVLLGFAVQGLGSGLLDGSWCAWAGTMERANTVSGLLHGAYSAGAAVGPLIVTLLTARRRAWFEWYYVLAGISLLSLTSLTTAFRHQSAVVYHHSRPSATSHSTKALLTHPATWLCAAYFLADVGVETAISGWVVSFMQRSRHASPYLSGLTSSGFWTGMAIGRLSLGPATDRIGVRRATILYFACAIAIQGVFVVVRGPVVSLVLMSVLGVVMGPLFPSGVVVLTQVLPREMHVAGVSFVASVGQVGGGLLPFGIGAVVEGWGIGVFRYAVLGLLVVGLGVWCVFARVGRRVSPGVGGD
ncbi:MFS general substrate transporter [Dothidotthia symphoricarpi CBS 119687]|uniref:MFS general substrate transporter n=1 Tax=Dothidotthia symphoricarpi CBS 119687 TaxID=1392245 RepID=A0A6A6AHM0_9PLEO|nr:MFS general substrate transporter [Dothidotthia symphoricarpi CBS 119687]KAF2131310.1 MFS general substrate transporter [Dothidotthia symphoricarpi CBS 119687]